MYSFKENILHIVSIAKEIERQEKDDFSNGLKDVRELLWKMNDLVRDSADDLKKIAEMIK